MHYWKLENEWYKQVYQVHEKIRINGRACNWHVINRGLKNRRNICLLTLYSKNSNKSSFLFLRSQQLNEAEDQHFEVEKREKPITEVVSRSSL